MIENLLLTCSMKFCDKDMVTVDDFIKAVFIHNDLESDNFEKVNPIFFIKFVLYNFVAINIFCTCTRFITGFTYT